MIQIKLTFSVVGGAFFHLLITFVNSLDPDQDRRFVDLDQVPNCTTL